VVIVFALMAHGERQNLRWRPDVVHRHIAGRPNRHHQFASQRVAASLAVVERRACKLPFDGHSQLVDGLLHTLELLGGLCSQQQVLEGIEDILGGVRGASALVVLVVRLFYTSGPTCREMPSSRSSLPDASTPHCPWASASAAASRVTAP